MYGLKEKTIGKLLIRIMQISKDSEDGYNLLNWKQPGQTTASRMAGDFAGRCYEVIMKRPIRTEGMSPRSVECFRGFCHVNFTARRKEKGLKAHQIQSLCFVVEGGR